MEKKIRTVKVEVYFWIDFLGSWFLGGFLFVFYIKSFFFPQIKVRQKILFYWSSYFICQLSFYEIEGFFLKSHHFKLDNF